MDDETTPPFKTPGVVFRASSTEGGAVTEAGEFIASRWEDGHTANGDATFGNSSADRSPPTAPPFDRLYLSGMEGALGGVEGVAENFFRAFPAAAAATSASPLGSPNKRTRTPTTGRATPGTAGEGWERDRTSSEEAKTASSNRGGGGRGGTRGGTPVTPRSPRREPPVTSPGSLHGAGAAPASNPTPVGSEYGLGSSGGSHRTYRGGHGSVSTPVEDIKALVAAVPTSDVAQAYLMGQRNAMESAFHEALPQRQLLGAMQAALADVRGRQQETAERCEALERETAVVEETARHTQEAVDAVVRGSLPSLERAVGELRARLSATEASVRERSLMSLCGEVGARVFRSAIQQAARADVVAAVVARRILRGGTQTAEGDGGRGGGSGDAEASAGAGEAGWGGKLSAAGAVFDEVVSSAGVSRASSREALGTVMVVLGAEAGYQLQRGMLRRSPRVLQRAAAPLSLGVQVVRVAVWASALTLAAGAAKDWCYQAADRTAAEFEAAMKRMDVGGWEDHDGGNEEGEEEDEQEEFLEAEDGGDGEGQVTPMRRTTPSLIAGNTGESFANTH